MKLTKFKIFIRIWIALGVAFTIWLWYSYQAIDIGDVLLSNSTVHVEHTADMISFTPAKPYQKIFIFFPGAMVDPVAYAPLCRKMADNGYKSILIKMPWRLANYGYNKPKELGLLNDSTKQYLLAGHSKGGSMAAQFVYENPGLIDGLILMGTTHPRDISLSGSNIPVIKIYGSKDGVADVEGVNSNRSKLPAKTKYVLIEGGNHSQFGYYGFQFGDHKASISREKQQQLILDNVLSFIK